jgi:uncharacterized membrane protein HdeD (DUF308 family)
MSEEQHGKQGRGQIIVFLIALYRGVLAIVLGIVLIFSPSKSESLLFNVMGFFWLSSGFALIRRPDTKRVMGNRMSWVAGLVGIFTGLLVVTRNITRQWVPEFAVFELLGAVILFTGVLHTLGEFRLGGVIKRRHETLNFLLGLFEVVLGLVLILSPLEHGPITYWMATIWALAFGTLVIGDALAQRAQARRRERKDQSEPSGMDGE